MGTWKCRQCGYELIPGKKYCSRCGAPAVWNVEKTDTEHTQEKNSLNEQNNEEKRTDVLFRKIESETIVTNGETVEKEENSKKGAILFGLFMGVILFGVLMSPFLMEKVDKNIESESMISESSLKKSDEKKTESKMAETKKAESSVALTESAQSETQETESFASEYILAGSDSRYITREELENLSRQECRLARNELYARRGRYFTDKELQDYFNSCSWYQPYIQPEDFQDSLFNQYELANRDLLLQYENELK